MIQLYRIVCKDCAWFQTFETIDKADEAARLHHAKGHRTERREFEGKPPTLCGKSHLIQAIKRVRCRN